MRESGIGVPETGLMAIPYIELIRKNNAHLA